jgi:hypothetical protein
MPKLAGAWALVSAVTDQARVCFGRTETSRARDSDIVLRRQTLFPPSPESEERASSHGRRELDNSLFPPVSELRPRYFPDLPRVGVKDGKQVVERKGLGVAESASVPCYTCRPASD